MSYSFVTCVRLILSMVCYKQSSGYASQRKMASYISAVFDTKRTLLRKPK